MTTFLRVLFVCSDDICLAPMATQILLNMVRKKKINSRFFISSAGAMLEEKDVDKEMHEKSKKCLKNANIDIGVHTSVRLKKEDAEKYDWILCMDEACMKKCFATLGDHAVYVTPIDVKKIFVMNPASPISLNGMIKARVCRLMDFTGLSRDIDNPLLTGDFWTAYREIYSGCASFITLATR